MRLHRIETPETRGPRTKREAVLLAGLPLLVALLVGALLGRVAPLGDDWIFFSHFDHVPLLPDGTASESAVLTNSAVADGLRFRPFAYAHMWFERRAFGGSFAADFWIGIVYLGLTGSMLALLLAALRAPPARAVVAGMLLLAHPAQAEVYGWASARVDTMAAFYGLAALYLDARGRRLASLLAFAAAFGSKESAYPLVLLPPLLALLERPGLRATLGRALPALTALGAVVALKLYWVGSFFAASWSQAVADIPLADHLAGYATYFSPLLLRPTASGADRTGAFLGAVFTALVLVSLLLPLCVAVVRRDSLVEARRRVGRKLPVTLLLLAGFVLTLAATFGVPVRPDFGGGRLWLLPCAFLVAVIACSCRSLPLWLALVPGFLLLDRNLAPYREANRRMNIVLDRLSVEVAAPDRAVRVRELQRWYGPVPLFAIMTNYYHETLPGPVDPVAPVFLTRDDQRAKAAEALARDDRRWREAMRKQGRDIVDLRWDSANGQLRDVKPAPGRK